MLAPCHCRAVNGVWWTQISLYSFLGKSTHLISYKTVDNQRAWAFENVQSKGAYLFCMGKYRELNNQHTNTHTHTYIYIRDNGTLLLIYIYIYVFFQKDQHNHHCITCSSNFVFFLNLSFFQKRQSYLIKPISLCTLSWMVWVSILSANIIASCKYKNINIC